jgi:hypothetical protein
VASGSFIPPSGYDLMTVTMYGANGGSGNGYSGGFGAKVQATFLISALSSSTLYFSVGGRGANEGPLAAGGFNGGTFCNRFVVLCLWKVIILLLCL